MLGAGRDDLYVVGNPARRVATRRNFSLTLCSGGVHTKLFRQEEVHILALQFSTAFPRATDVYILAEQGLNEIKGC